MRQPPSCGASHLRIGLLSEIPATIGTPASALGSPRPDVEGFLKVCYGSWGQKGCFSVNSMREFADLPPKARKIMIANMTKAHQLLIDPVLSQWGKTYRTGMLAGWGEDLSLHHDCLL